MGRWFEKIRKKPPAVAAAEPCGPVAAPAEPSAPRSAAGASAARPAAARAVKAGVRRVVPGGAGAASAPQARSGVAPAGAPAPRPPVPPIAGPAEVKAESLRGAQSPKAIYKQLMGSFYDAILIADNKGHVVDNNQRAVEFFGYSSEELWDMPVARLIAGLNEAVYERIRRAIGSDRFVLMNTRCMRLDGTRFPAEVGISMVALLGQDDFVFTVRNVERRLTQLRNLRSGQNAFLNAQSGCFVCDEQGCVVAANAAFLGLLQISPDRSVTGVAIGTLLPDVTVAFARAAGGEVVALDVSAPGGTERFRLQLAPNHQGASRIEGVVGSLLPLREGISPGPAAPLPTPG